MRNLIGSKKISLKAGTDEADIYRGILEEDPGLKKLLIEPGLAAYLMSDGTTVEIYGQGFAYPDYLFNNANVVISYKVASIESKVKSLEQKGAKLLGKIEQVCTSYKYCHILTKEYNVIGLYQQS